MQGLQQTFRLLEWALFWRTLVRYILIRHDHQEPFTSILVCLKLVVLGVYASTTTQKEQKFGGEMRVVARFCDVDLTLISGHDPEGL